MLDFDEIVAKASDQYYPSMKPPFFDFIEASRQDNPFWEISDFLEFALIQEIVIEDAFLAEIKEYASSALSGEVAKRTLDLLAKHEERNAALDKQ